MGKPTWTEPQIEILTSMVTSGKRYALIAAALETTKNAVIGKAHRMGLVRKKPRATNLNLSRRAPNIFRGQPSQRSFSPRPRRPEPSFKPTNGFFTGINMEEHFPVDSRLSVYQLKNGRCRFPVGEASALEFFFCGAEFEGSGPYCDRCSAWCYLPPVERRERPSWTRS